MKSSQTRLEIKKVIRANRNKVFEAWTQPEMIRKWMAPGTSTHASMQAEFKVGGAYRIEMSGEMGGSAYDVVVHGVYTQIVPSEFIAFTWIYEDPERRASVGSSLVSVALRDVDGGTEVTLTHERFASGERRDGHHVGWRDSLEKLAVVCEAGSRDDLSRTRSKA